MAGKRAAGPGVCLPMRTSPGARGSAALAPSTTLGTHGEEAQEAGSWQ